MFEKSWTDVPADSSSFECRGCAKMKEVEVEMEQLMHDAFPARATLVRPHEPSSRHVDRLHGVTVQLSSPFTTSERPCQPSSRNVAVSTIY